MIFPFFLLGGNWNSDLLGNWICVGNGFCVERD